MKTHPIPQLSAAIALVQLLTEHPELSEHISWSIGRSAPRLFGLIHDGGQPVLDQCVDIIGGSVTDGIRYERRSVPGRDLEVSSVWRDVPVEIVMWVPNSVQAVAA